MTKVKWDGLEDESNSYAGMLIFCLVFVLEGKNAICIWKEMLVHSWMCYAWSSLWRLSSPRVVLGFHLEKSYIWASSLFFSQNFTFTYRNLHLSTSAGINHLIFCLLLTARNFRVRNNQELVFWILLNRLGNEAHSVSAGQLIALEKLGASPNDIFNFIWFNE